MRTGSRIPPTVKLSQLEIDADKSWNYKRITDVASLEVEAPSGENYAEATVRAYYPSINAYASAPETSGYPAFRLGGPSHGIIFTLRSDGGMNVWYWDRVGGTTDHIAYITKTGDLYIDGSYYTWSPKLPSDPALIAKIIEEEVNKRPKDIGLMALGSGKLVAHLYRRIIELEEKVKRLERLLGAGDR